MINQNSITICSKAAEASSDFEFNNSSLKKEYLIKNILLYNSLMKTINGNCGTFGTGYPFYILGEEFKGELPIIYEQIRYNNELIKAVECSNYNVWACTECLSDNGHLMPDLKQVCRSCSEIDDNLKPRKILNRLPDIDMWTICDSSCIEEAKKNQILLFQSSGISPSDVNPIETIFDIISINKDIKDNKLPEKSLPIDAHIIDYETLFNLIEKVPFIVRRALKNGEIPYLAIHPISYRKKWQYDDTPYNFIHDYLSSLTDFSFKKELKEILEYTRKEIVSSCTKEELYKCLLMTGPESVSRRHKTKELKIAFEERIKLWEK